MRLFVVLDVKDLAVAVVVVTACARCLLVVLLLNGCSRLFSIVLKLLKIVLLVDLLLCSKSSVLFYTRCCPSCFAVALLCTRHLRPDMTRSTAQRARGCGSS